MGNYKGGINSQFNTIIKNIKIKKLWEVVSGFMHDL